MQRWLETARIVFGTALVTSAAWAIGGAIWVQGERQRWQAEDRPRVVEVVREAASPRNAPVPQEADRLVIPVAGVRPLDLVDTFAQERAGGGRAHDAIDIVAPRGTPVLAAASGEIEKLFDSTEGGRTIYVRSPDRLTLYYYAHLDSYAPGLAERQHVRAGQPIGTVGSTGNADPTAPHLHFAILRTRPHARWHEPATPINPYPVLAPEAE